MRYQVRIGSRSTPLDERDVVIGRSAYCSLVVDVPTVSRVHLSVRLAGDQVEIRDLGSSTGTFVNGARVDGVVVVTSEDEIRAGRERIFVEAVPASGMFKTLNNIPPTSFRRGPS